jgi:hypothetical protein
MAFVRKVKPPTNAEGHDSPQSASDKKGGLYKDMTRTARLNSSFTKEYAKGMGLDPDEFECAQAIEKALYK